MSATVRVSVQLHPAAPPALTSELLERVARFALAAEGVTGPLAVGLVITDDATIQELHARHMGIDEPTDVLTFALGDGETFISAETAPLLGEVIVSVETAAAQAAAEGHSPVREVCFLVVHGLLHLLGYDDATEAERATMLARQAAILADFEHQVGPLP